MPFMSHVTNPLLQNLIPCRFLQSLLSTSIVSSQIELQRAREMATHLLFQPLSLKPLNVSAPFSATTTTKLRVETRRRRPARQVAAASAKNYQVTIEHEGKSTTLEVGEDESILERALDEGLEVPHDCKLGVCMTCPARLVTGEVDQSGGMLSDDVVERGYALLCASYPRSDCHIRTIPEEELLSLQLVTSAE